MRDMKTHRELIAESERLDHLGQQYWETYHRSVAQLREPALESRVLFRFPATTITERVGAGRHPGATETHRIARCIEVDFGKVKPEYTLIEEDYSAEPGEGVELLGAVQLMRSETVADVLAEGYQMVEEDRLGESLAPFMERMDGDALPSSVDPGAIAEIEQIVSAGDLTASQRMHTKADIVAFLEGRLGSSEFIAAVVERHRHRKSKTETILESRSERLCIDKP